MKNKFLDISNAVTWLKSIGVGIVAGLTTLPVFALMWFVRPTMPMVGNLIGLFALIVYALSWGYFSKRFFGWK